MVAAPQLYAVAGQAMVSFTVLPVSIALPTRSAAAL
jgi:hypothetical protein